MRVAVIVLLAFFCSASAYAQRLHLFCASAVKPVQSDLRLSEAVRAAFGPTSFTSRAEECIYPLKALRYAGADVLLTQGNVPGEACHGCSARLSAYVLRRTGGDLKLAARFVDFAEAGTFGSAGDISPITIGGDDGIVIESGGTFQGNSFSVLDFYVFRPGRVVHLVEKPVVTIDADNSGASVNDADAVSVKGSWSIGPAPHTALNVDYKITAHGRTRVEHATWALEGSRFVSHGLLPPEVDRRGG